VTARALAQRLPAEVVGVDVAAHLLRHAAAQSPHLPLRWVLGQAEALPLADQAGGPRAHVIARENRGPQVALQAWVPFRFFPKVAHVFVH
jgi:Methyltransferase domain